MATGSLVRDVLADVSRGDEHIAAAVGETRDAEPDRLAIARIGRERDAALARCRRDQDLRTLERTMGSLDEQEAEANVGGSVTALEASEVVAYLRDLPHLRDDAPGSRRALAKALLRSCRDPGIAPDVDRADAISDRRGRFARICWLWSGRGT